MNLRWFYVFDITTSSSGWSEMTAAFNRYTIGTIPGLEAWFLE